MCWLYLLLLPIAVANLELDERQIKRLLGGVMALAIVKAVIGLVEYPSISASRSKDPRR